MEAAAVLLAFVLGGTLGWSLRPHLDPTPSRTEQLLADASYAYLFYTADRDYSVEFAPHEADRFEAIAARVFEPAPVPPDLQTIGYEYRGARLTPTSRTTATLFFFEDEAGQQIMVLSWPAEATPAVGSGLLDLNGVAIRFWSLGGLGLAVLGKGVREELTEVSEAVASFYRQVRRSG